MGFSKLKSAEALRMAESSLLFLCHCNTQAFQADWASSAESIWSQGPAPKAAPKHRYTKELPTFWPKFCQGQLNLFSHQCYPLCLNPFPTLLHVTLPFPYSPAAIPSPLPSAPAASLQSKPAFSLSGWASCSLLSGHWPCCTLLLLHCGKQHLCGTSCQFLLSPVGGQ